MKSRVAAFVALAVVAGLVPLTGASRAQTVDPTIPPQRETEPVVLTGANFPEWAALGDVALKANSVEGARCEANKQGFGDTPLTPDESCTHNRYEDPDLSTQEFLNGAGVPTDRLLGYRWGDNGFQEIPFQVDEMFIHYLSNNNSGFSFYSETDHHVTYAFDREGFRWTASDESDPCLAQPASEVAEDPVPGLDTDDELTFMYRDVGGRAPTDAALPSGIEDSYEVAVSDPYGETFYVYVMKSSEDGPAPSFDASNGYVRYERDPDANVFLFSESSFENYGATEHGPWFDPATGVCHSAPDEFRQHRPGDQATITTPRYRFRYEGRWLMTELQVSQAEEGDWTYGPDLVDQWKARAFQQRPGGQTPCCGYEEEVNNWGGSSILMGELSGPVRTIRETWGADSGTNVVRREIFYRDEIRFGAFLRVHVIPPGDGIYAQWDYNAGLVDTYYNPYNPEGVAIDGRDDEVFGNSRVFVGQEGVSFDPNGEGDPITVGEPDEECSPDDACINNDVDSPDPTHSGLNAGLNWEQITGANGTLVIRSSLKHITPGAAHSVVAVPYYRDDSCFDDGTGSNPGPHLNPRAPDEGEFAQWEGRDRTCWDVESDPVPPPEGDPRHFQGSIGTHGVHILLIAETDNAHTTLPITEFDTDQRMVVLPGRLPNVGEAYGRNVEKGTVVTIAPEARAAGGDPEPTASTSTSPSPTPDPEPRTSRVAFTDASATAGDFSDDARIEARLADDESGDALPGEELTFELTGADGTTSWTETTNVDGIAGQNVPLDRKPGSYQLTVRYAGDEQHAAAADQTSFVIEREDTAMTLIDEGKGNNRALVATLSDADSGAGIAERSVAFSADGDSLGSATTDGDGAARLDLPPRYRNGHHDYEALFGGDDFYLGASDSRQT